LLDLFFLQKLVSPSLEMGKATVEFAARSPVEPDGPCAELLEKAAVVADEDERRSEAEQFLFQPFDGWQVQMVGGFIEQQDVGRGRQCAGKGGAPDFTARERGRRFLAREPQFLQQIAAAMLIVRRSEAVFHIVQHRLEAGKIGFLGQITDGSAGLQPAFTFVRFDPARRNL
jgi:hypothetical protein